MAARTRATTLSEAWREKIQASMLINTLQEHIFKEKPLQATQLKAIEILLRKVAPDLSQVDGNLNVVTTPEARVYPMGKPDDNRLPPSSEAVDSVH